MKNYEVNEIGLQQIKQFLMRWHKSKDSYLYSTDCLKYYAALIEGSLEENKGAQFTLSYFVTITGRDEVCTITDEGYTVTERIELHNYL